MSGRCVDFVWWDKHIVDWVAERLQRDCREIAERLQRDCREYKCVGNTL